MLGVDRLDYSKGIFHRINAFDRFLEVNPEWRSRVTCLQITPKSRGDIKEYAAIENEVTTLISRSTAATARRPGRRSAMSIVPIRAPRSRASIVRPMWRSLRRFATA